PPPPRYRAAAARTSTSSSNVAPSHLRLLQWAVSAAADICICIYQAKQLSPGGEPRDLREERQEALPGLLRQQRLHPGLRPLPRGAGLGQLRGPGRGDGNQLLAAVLPGTSGDPSGGHQGTKVAGERRFLELGEPAQVALADRPGPRQDAEQ